MSGVSDLGALSALAEFERAEQVRSRDLTLITRVLFVVFLAFAPVFCWVLVEWAWAPVPYFLVFVVRHSESFVVLIPVALSVAFYWWMARGTAAVVVFFDSRWVRFLITAMVISVVAVYVGFGKYAPLNGGTGPWLSFIGVMKHALDEPGISGFC
jgi:hypothetical protein